MASLEIIAPRQGQRPEEGGGISTKGEAHIIDIIDLKSWEMGEFGKFSHYRD